MWLIQRLSESAPNPSPALVEQLRAHRLSQRFGVLQQQLFHCPTELPQFSPFHLIEGAFGVSVHEVRQALSFLRRQPT
jgi:hypothetical protein